MCVPQQISRANEDWKRRFVSGQIHKVIMILIDVERVLLFTFFVLGNINIATVNGWLFNCRVSEWSLWSRCSSTCGSLGERVRKRFVISAPELCSDSLIEREGCNIKCCPVDCVYHWSPWTSCNGCGSNGQQYASRIITQDKSCGGECDVTIRTRKCDTGRYTRCSFYKLPSRQNR